jgi:hypothetical protein
VPAVRLEPTIPASAWPQTYDLDRAATGIGTAELITVVILHVVHKHSLRLSRYRMISTEKSELNRKRTRAMRDDLRIRDLFWNDHDPQEAPGPRAVCETSEPVEAEYS